MARGDRIPGFMTLSGTHGPKRREADPLDRVQWANCRWWQETPKNYDWRGDLQMDPLTLEWFVEQDRRNAEVHKHFASDRFPFDRLISYDTLVGQEVLEVGIGSGFHAELLGRAVAVVTGIDLTR